MFLNSTDKISDYIAANKDVRMQWDRIKTAAVSQNMNLIKLIDDNFQESEFYNIALLARWNRFGYVDDIFNLMLRDFNQVYRNLVKSMLI
jgi:hypothetical protein